MRLFGLFLVFVLVFASAFSVRCAEAFDAPDLTTVASRCFLAEKPIAVVTNGIVALPIVVGESAKDTQSAILLADFVERSTGAKPPIMRECAGVPSGIRSALFLGDVSETRRLELSAPTNSPHAFRVVAKNGGIFFLGRVDCAVCDFLERFLGVRVYGPADDDAFIPKCRDFTVPAVDYADWPMQDARGSGGDDGAVWARFGKAGGDGVHGLHVHAPHGWYRDAALVAVAPEIFAKSVDGSHAKTPMLCYGNPETLLRYEAAIDAEIYGIRRAGDLVDLKSKAVTLSPWDAQVDCRCEDCRALLEPDRGSSGSASELIWRHFAKRLAHWLKWCHPDYRLEVIAYANYVEPPREVDFLSEGNVEAVVCTMPGMALLKNTACRLREEELLRRWAAITGRPVRSWHYGCWPAEFTATPYLYGETVVNHCRAMRGTVGGTFVCGGANDPRFALVHYVWLRAMWNPTIDVSAVYDGYATRAFGAAAQPMRKLLALRESAWNRQWSDDSCRDSNVYGLSYPPEIANEMKRLLTAARAAAKCSDSAVLRRIARQERIFSRFFKESDALAAGWTPEAWNVPRAPSGEAARTLDVAWPGLPLAPTAVAASWREDALLLTFRCCGRAALDEVAFYFDETGGERGTCRAVTVRSDGTMIESADGQNVPCLVNATVSADSDGWKAEVEIPAAIGYGRYWRVNAVRRLARTETELELGRVTAHARLSSRGSPRDMDRSAFVELRFVQR